jgi:Fic family protein
MATLERFMHDDPAGTPALLKAALAHVQFETIHPFLDGNGRVGRLLITLLLCAEGILSEPLLYLSLYFKEHRARYYELLDSVRREGEWEEWLEFFADGVVETAHRLLEVGEADRDRIQRLGRRAGSAALVHQTMQRVPICTIARLADQAKLTLPTVSKALDVLVESGIVQEITGRKRSRIYRYDGYMDILSQGTELA